MSITIKYHNELGTEIAFQQINNLPGYFKVFYNSDQVQKKEYYFNGQLQNTSYVAHSESDINSILTELPNVSIEYLYLQMPYKINEIQAYTNGLLSEKRINVFNSADGLICSKSYQTVNNALTVVSTEKYYFDDNGEEKYIFTL